MFASFSFSNFEMFFIFRFCLLTFSHPILCNPTCRLCFCSLPVSPPPHHFHRYYPLIIFFFFVVFFFTWSIVGLYPCCLFYIWWCASFNTIIPVYASHSPLITVSFMSLFCSKFICTTKQQDAPVASLYSSVSSLTLRNQMLRVRNSSASWLYLHAP